jgi:DNA modification methylase
MLVVPDGLPPREQHDNRMVPAAMPALSRRALPLGEGRRVTAGEWATSGVAAEGDVVSGWHLLTGDCREVLPTLGVEADAVVCDPPYDLTNRVIDAWACRLCGRIRGGLDTDPGVCLGCGGPMHRRRSAGGGFMGKAWDATGVAFDPATWRIVKDAMKPGAYLLAFGSTRTYHRLVCAVEDAGFSIIDTIVWHHGQGFPKHKSLLKPASELIVLARKPGTGPGLNVDACRVEVNGGRPLIAGDPKDGRFAGVFRQGSSHAGTTTAGRYPPNLLLSHSPGCRRVGTKRVRGSNVPGPQGHKAAFGKNGVYGEAHGRHGEMPLYTDADHLETVESWECARDPDTLEYICPIALLDEQAGERPVSGSAKNGRPSTARPNSIFGGPRPQGTLHNDAGGPSRYFPTFAPDAEDAPVMRAYYCAKASRVERSLGLPDGMVNRHSTVKPVALMKFLTRLVTPSGGLILDPFLGSGTTGCAAVAQGFAFVGIDQSEEYVEWARHRIAWWAANPDGRATGATAPKAKGRSETAIYANGDGIGSTRRCNVCGCQTVPKVYGLPWPTCGHDDWAWVPRQAKPAPPADGYRPLSLFAAGDD